MAYEKDIDNAIAVANMKKHREAHKGFVDNLYDSGYLLEEAYAVIEGACIDNPSLIPLNKLWTRKIYEERNLTSTPNKK